MDVMDLRLKLAYNPRTDIDRLRQTMADIMSDPKIVYDHEIILLSVDGETVFQEPEITTEPEPAIEPEPEPEPIHQPRKPGRRGGDIVLWMDIVRDLRDQRRRGIVKSGDQLPFLTHLAASYDVGHNTVARAVKYMVGHKELEVVGRNKYFR